MAPMNEFSLLRKIEMDIDRKGFHLIVIKGPNSEFLYSHSIGLYKLGQPELVFMNSSIEQAEEFTELCDVKKTVICHHAPYRSDTDIDELKAKISSGRISFGCEKMSFDI